MVTPPPFTTPDCLLIENKNGNTGLKSPSSLLGLKIYQSLSLKSHQSPPREPTPQETLHKACLPLVPCYFSPEQGQLSSWVFPFCEVCCSETLWHSLAPNSQEVFLLRAATLTAIFLRGTDNSVLHEFPIWGGKTCVLHLLRKSSVTQYP